MKIAGYDFEGPFFDPHTVKELPGVYVVLNLQVLDVGESGGGSQGLSRRLRRHSRKPCWEEHQGKGRLAFAVLYEPDADERQRIEQELRAALQPPCGTTPLL